MKCCVCGKDLSIFKTVMLVIASVVAKIFLADESDKIYFVCSEECGEKLECGDKLDAIKRK